ncbi:hypothetical protein [Streptomyces sp. NPDC087298]
MSTAVRRAPSSRADRRTAAFRTVVGRITRKAADQLRPDLR